MNPKIVIDTNHSLISVIITRGDTRIYLTNSEARALAASLIEAADEADGILEAGCYHDRLGGLENE